MRLAVAAGSLALTLIPTTAATAATAPDPVYQYAVAHPLDLAGLDRISRQYTGAGIDVQLNGVDGLVSGTEAQRILDSRWAARKSDRAAGQLKADPADNLSVGFTWVGTVARGIWDFRDGFVGGVKPVDLSSVQLSLGCTEIKQTITRTYDYTNKQTANAAYLYHGGLGTNAPISAVKDATSGHMMVTDHGVTDIVLSKPRGCAKHRHGAQYTYEHNQGQSSISASAGWGFLSVSYGGGGVHFQKGTNPSYKSF
ncbi:hypothetical protein E1263_39785 [Kribbella antibiotica]|uniref:Uncharacterized protein n=1 Tax=Kribbella antibiotica TaxID=190195 RepID=A0A4R4YJ17_9ACTN|nr:hypothetical protein [Kribbella antibiotica]TDD44918.1 hypothetical protein E1263_39785 [Kribbella antibiotica]